MNMADKEIIIKMSEEMYNWVNDVNKFYDDYGIGDFIDLIKNGTPLPVKHGRLVDEKDLSLMTVHMIDGKLVCDAPTIVEANYASLEEKHLGNPEDKAGIYADDYDEMER